MNVHRSLRRGKNDPEKVFQGSPQGCYSHHRPRSKAVSSLVLKGRVASPDWEGQDEPAQRLRGRLPWQSCGRVLTKTQRIRVPSRDTDDSVTPVGLKDRVLSPRGLFWSLNI